MTDLEPREWSDIYPSEDAHEGNLLVREGYTSISNSLRSYRGTIYVTYDDGWVSLDSVIDAMKETIQDNE